MKVRSDSYSPRRGPAAAVMMMVVVQVTALALMISFAAPVHGWQQQQAAAPVVSKAAETLSASERAAAARVSAATIRAVTTALSADEMQGRGTATPGGERAARYIADQFARLGLKPLGDNGTFLQPIKFQSTQVLPETSLRTGDVALKLTDEFVVSPPHTAAQLDASGEQVFVGYGAVSPALKRDDLAQLDVEGKIVVLMSGRPKNVDGAAWEKAVSTQATLLGLIGRGAAGIIMVNVGTKEQPFSLISNYLSRRRVAVAGTGEPPFKLPPIIIASDAAAEKLFAGTGQTFAQVRQMAEGGEFVSRNMNKRASIAVRVQKEVGTSSNVAGVLEGSDPKLKEEAVIYTAHYDAYGMGADGRIYPGAADNALGVAEIVAIAEGLTKLPARPRRSVIFLAVTGEEYGLLGAEHWVKNPTWPIDKIAANLNFDGIGTEVYGPVKKIVGFGMEHSDLGPVLAAVAAATDTAIIPDPLPEEKAFYRSDHYAFVKKGVPALMLLGGPAGDTASFVARMKRWLETDYHQTTDTIRPDWNWDGPRLLAVVGLIVGMRVADVEALPQWLPSSPFNKPRAAARATAGAN